VSAALDATDSRARLAEGAESVERATARTLGRCAARQADVGAFAALWPERALERARELDRARAAGEPCGPLFGVPFALKSNLCLSGEVAHCGSRVLEGWRAPYTATAVERLLEAGAVPVGATHMDEFGFGSSGENSAYGVPRNPWDGARTCGGSSSGSAAAVAAGLVPLALGSDTGGSVRQPAALCGVAGLKPTFGRVSRYGLVAFGSSLDCVSPLARSVRDLELALAVISGSDARDATCLDLPPCEPGPSAAPARLDGLCFGVPAPFVDALEDDARARFDDACAVLEELGAKRRALELPSAAQALSIYYVLATAEASSNLARFDGVRYGPRRAGDGSLQGMVAATRGELFGAEAVRRILLGTYVLQSGYRDAWYATAGRARELLRAEFARAFERVDVIVGATTPGPAFRLGERDRDPLAMYRSDVLTVPASLAGLPALSLPAGFVERDGRALPLGLQICAPAREDARALRVARALEAARADLRASSPVALEEARA
jgi:aspartyl-tRNA(Asn)/glutamyl-tRNA(Gln) amidotransferase subunit A